MAMEMITLWESVEDSQELGQTDTAGMDDVVAFKAVDEGEGQLATNLRRRRRALMQALPVSGYIAFALSWILDR